MKIVYTLLLPSLFLMSCGEKSESKEENSSSENTDTPSETVVEEETCEALNTFIPKGWKTLKKATGDLNKDGIDDVALVVQNTDPSKISTDSPMEMNANDRQLIILFGKKKADCYSLSTKSETFILKHDQENMDEPFEDISISKGTLKISFKEFYTMGSWSTGSSDYIWRFQDGDFKLIGANTSNFHRADGDAVDVSVNFSTNKYSVKTYNMFDEDVKEVETWKKLQLKELKTFSSFKKPWTWNINEDVNL